MTLQTYIKNHLCKDERKLEGGDLEEQVGCLQYLGLQYLQPVLKR